MSSTKMAAMVVVVSLCAACGGDDDEQDVSDVIAALPGNATTGATVFGNTCASSALCHGDPAMQGDPFNGTNLSVRIPALSDEALATTIRYGFDTSAPYVMPAQSSLSATQIADTMAHLRATFP